MDDVFQPDTISFTFKDSPTECLKVKIPPYTVELERFNADDVGVWVHEFSEIALRFALVGMVEIGRYKITMGSWTHNVTLEHKLTSIATGVGIFMNDGTIENMSGDDYWWHIVTGVPPSFYYTRK